MHIITRYENYKGGINNLQIVDVIDGRYFVKRFTSLKGLAEKRAWRFIKKQTVVFP